MTAREYERILDSMSNMGVYVIREDTHEILYLNKRIRSLFPDAKLGDCWCRYWGKPCGSCHLDALAYTEEVHSVLFDSPLGTAVDYTAVRITWEGDIPAVMVTATTRTEAASDAYVKVLRVNLDTLSYEAIKDFSEETGKLHSQGRTIEALLDHFLEKGNIYPDDMGRFARFTDPVFVKNEIDSGKSVLACAYRCKVGDGYRWHILEILPEVGNRHLVMVYVKDINDSYKEGILQEDAGVPAREIISSLGEQNYGIYVIELATGRLEAIRASEQVAKAMAGGHTTWQEIVGDLSNICIHPDDRVEFGGKFSYEALNAAWQMKKERVEMIARRQFGDEYRFVEITAHLSKNRAGGGYAVLALQDVEDKIRQERAAYREASDKASIINSLVSMYYAVYFVDLETNGFMPIRQMEEEVRSVLGDRINYADAVAAYASKFVHPDDRGEYLTKINYASLMRTLSEGKPFVTVEYRRIKNRPDGQIVPDGWVRVNIVLAEQADGVPKKALYVSQDITETKEREEQERQTLREAVAAANHANASKSEFLSRMSHDIRTPMNAIIGMTAIAGTHLDDRDRVADCLNKITVSSRHLLSLINEVLDMSKIESGKIDLSEEEFNLSDLIQSLQTMIRPAVTAKRQRLELHIAKVLHEEVVGDLLRLQQVFMNILGNAVKYTPEGGCLEVKISEKESSVFGYGCYEFRFSDNGIGMTKEYIQKIFEPFSRAEDSRVSRIEGTGLGMTIALNIVRMMNGTIEAESEPGKGSVFTVTVFLKQRDVSDGNLDKLADLPVLVVDDDRDACEATCAVLEDIGMKGEWVLSGAEAVQRVWDTHCAGEDFFAVILDWKMPDMDGIETARAIREKVGPDLPIIILSAYDWSDVELEARRAGISGFIAKPLFKSRLVYVFQKIAGEEEVELESHADAEPMDFSDKRILLVEDNELNLEIAEEIISSTGVAVESASNGQEALNRFIESETGHYDLIFMDIQMPVMNGYEASRAIRSLERPDAITVPIIAMTANAFAEDVVASRQAGMDEHITKPLAVEQLMECMHHWLGRK